MPPCKGTTFFEICNTALSGYLLHFRNPFADLAWIYLESLAAAYINGVFIINCVGVMVDLLTCPLL